MSYSGFDPGVDRVERLVERDVGAGAELAVRVARHHVQPGQPVAAQRDHDVAGVRVDAEEPDAGLVREHGLPLLVAGGVQRRLGQLEVLGAVVVHDQQPVAGRLDVVLHALAARRDHPRLALRVGGVEQPVPRGQLAAGTPITIHRSSRLGSTPSQNRSSGSVERPRRRSPGRCRAGAGSTTYGPPGLVGRV